MTPSSVPIRLIVVLYFLVLSFFVSITTPDESDYAKLLLSGM